MGEVNNVAVVLVFLVLSILILVALVYGLINYETVLNKYAGLAQNPYCLRRVCTVGGAPTSTVYTLPINQDPIRFAYSNYNFCLNNGITCDVLNSLRGSPGSTPMSADQVTVLMAFYNTQYLPRCSYGWGGGQKVATCATAPGTGCLPASPPDGALSDPNSDPLVNGPNDEGLVALLARAKALNLTADPNYVALLRICGSQCT